MIIRLVLAIAVIVFLFWGYKRWRALPPEKRKSSSFTIILYALAILAVIAVLTGRLHWIGAAIAGAAAIAKFGFSTIVRAMPFLSFLRKSSFFAEPRFSTEFLKVQLNINTGHMTGEIIKGPHEGKRLETLSDDELATLETHYQERDKRSYFLIRVLRQRKGHAYENFNSGNEAYHSIEDPSLKEAEQILGLPEGYSKEDVIKAHKSLIQKLHPDRGGNDYLASRVNLAKDIILKNLR